MEFSTKLEIDTTGFLFFFFFFFFFFWQKQEQRHRQGEGKPVGAHLHLICMRRVLFRCHSTGKDDPDVINPGRSSIQMTNGLTNLKFPPFSLAPPPATRSAGFPAFSRVSPPFPPLWKHELCHLSRLLGETVANLQKFNCFPREFTQQNDSASLPSPPSFAVANGRTFPPSANCANFPVFSPFPLVYSHFSSKLKNELCYLMAYQSESAIEIVI